MRRLRLCPNRDNAVGLPTGNAALGHVQCPGNTRVHHTSKNWYGGCFTAHMAETEHVIETYFSRIGGAPAIGRIVEAFYARMDKMAEAQTIRAMHHSDLAPTKAILKDYLAEWLGGPALYSEKRGHPRLRMRHARFAIGPAERDAWIMCMLGALAETVPDEAVRAELERKLYQLADWVRNDEDNPHDGNHDKNH